MKHWFARKRPNDADVRVEMELELSQGQPEVLSKIWSWLTPMSRSTTPRVERHEVQGVEGRESQSLNAEGVRMFEPGTMRWCDLGHGRVDLLPGSDRMLGSVKERSAKSTDVSRAKHSKELGHMCWCEFRGR